MNPDRLHQQLRRMRARAVIRKWEARQVDHAQGVWSDSKCCSPERGARS